MIANCSIARWEQLQVNVQDECLTVYDNLSKRKRVYHVPYLLHAELAQNIVYIFTSNAKIMQLDLLTAARQFLSATQLENLTKVRKTHKTLQRKKSSAKKPQQAIENVESLSRYTFINTVNP